VGCDWLHSLSQERLVAGQSGTSGDEFSALSQFFVNEDTLGDTLLRVSEIDEAQYSSGQEPCLDAFQNQRVNRIDSTVYDQRWPDFAKMAFAHGILATLSVPVIARARVFGALNLYSRRAQAFDDHSVDRIETFARQAAIVLANAQVYWDAAS
jgi:GAF domain-containing protein